jgi:2-oxoglutarate ferredoxin oxidoreductase subunit delta
MSAAAAGPRAEAISRGTLVIDTQACKGCDLCIDACPPRVLVMTSHELNTRGYRYPVLLPGCTGCKACSQICPDFVFAVYKYDEPVVTPIVTPIEAIVAHPEETAP